MADGDNSSTNLIINYLPQTLTDEEFRSMFQSVGPLRASKVVRDRATGYSYGFGFVDYTCEADAKKAINTLNGLKLQNKTLKVAYARQGGETIKNANLYVTKVPRTMTAQDVEEMFSPYGDIVQCRVLIDQATGKHKGTAFVLFDQNSQADGAMKALNGTVPVGGTEGLNITFAEDNRGKARPPPMHMMNRGAASGGYGSGAGGYGGGGYGRPGGYGGGMGGGGPMRNAGMAQRHRFNPMNGNTNASTEAEDEGYIIFAYNIGLEAEERTLWQLFSPFGTVSRVNCIRDHVKNCCKGFGFVTMPIYQEAVNAIHNLNGQDFYGRPLQVAFKSPKA